MGRRRFLPARRGVIEQQVAPHRGINLTARRQFAEPLRLHSGIEPGRIAPVPGQIADDSGNPLLQQIAQFNSLNRQPVHRPPGFKRQPQQPDRLWRAVTQLGADQLGQPQPAPDRVSGGRHRAARAERIEQWPKRFIKIKIAHSGHPRQQHSAC